MLKTFLHWQSCPVQDHGNIALQMEQVHRDSAATSLSCYMGLPHKQCTACGLLHGHPTCGPASLLKGRQLVLQRLNLRCRRVLSRSSLPDDLQVSDGSMQAPAFTWCMTAGSTLLLEGRASKGTQTSFTRLLQSMLTDQRAQCRQQQDSRPAPAAAASSSSRSLSAHGRAYPWPGPGLPAQLASMGAEFC